jgi:hypothetical protein
MRVVVQVHRTARARFRVWLEAHAAGDEEREALIGLYMDELRRVLIERGGEIGEAICYREEEPRVYWWHYTGDLWVQFAVKTERPFRIRAETRRVILTDFRAEPPPGVDE